MFDLVSSMWKRFRQYLKILFHWVWNGFEKNEATVVFGDAVVGVVWILLVSRKNFCNWIFLKPCYRFVLNLHISNLGLSSFDVQKLKIQNYGPWSFLLSILWIIWKQNRKKLTYFVDSWWIFPSFMMKILTQSEFFTPYSRLLTLNQKSSGVVFDEFSTDFQRQPLFPFIKIFPTGLPSSVAISLTRRSK